MINSLQIGNWVRLKHMNQAEKDSGRYFVVKGIDLSHKSVLIGSQWIVHDKVEVIPIKRGWLMRLGFKETKPTKNYFKNSMLLNELSKKIYVYSISSYRHLMWSREMNMLLSHGDNGSSFLGNPMPNVKYVHQVQNLLELFSIGRDPNFNIEETSMDDLTKALYGKK